MTNIEPTDCINCETPYDVCTYGVLTDHVACCPACSYSATHDQNKWEEKYGVRYISDVKEERGTAENLAEEAVNAWLNERTEETLLAAITALQDIPVDKSE
jgi:hypothetical protein